MKMSPPVSAGESKVDVGNHYFLPGQSLQNFKYDGEIQLRTNQEILEKDEYLQKDRYQDRYQGLIQVRRGRWYGFNTSYGLGDDRATQNYQSLNYDQLPSLSYNEGVGSIPFKRGKLVKITISVTRPNSDIDNLQLFVNKMSKQDNSSLISNKTLLHESTPAQGHNIQNQTYKYITLDFDEEVGVNDVIQIFFNSSSSSGSTRYLYATEIKFIYE